MFLKTKDFRIPGIDYRSHIWHNFSEFGSSMLFNVVLIWLNNNLDLNNTGESYEDETRVWSINIILEPLITINFPINECCFIGTIHNSILRSLNQSIPSIMISRESVRLLVKSF